MVRWLRLETSVAAEEIRTQKKPFYIPIPEGVIECIGWAVDELRKSGCDYIAGGNLHCPSGRYIQVQSIDEVVQMPPGWVQFGPGFAMYGPIRVTDWDELTRLIALPIRQSFITHSLDDLFAELATLPTTVEAFQSMEMQVGGPATHVLLSVTANLQQEELTVDLARAIGIQIKADLVSDNQGNPTWLYTGQGVRLITFPSGNRYHAVGTGIAQTNRDNAVNWRKVSPADLTATNTSRYPKSRVWRQFNKRFGNPR